MKHYNFFTLLFMLTFCWPLLAQNQQIKKADKLYKQNEYSEAIALYEEGLREEQSLSAKTNLAYCYKMTNKLSHAEQLYSEIVKEAKAKPITQYYYGEILMGVGKYEEAKSWFLAYAKSNPDDHRALEMVEACEKVKSIRPLFGNILVSTFPHNSDADEAGPVFYRSGIVFASDRASGFRPLKKKSGWTGREFLQIYYSEEDQDGEFKKPQKFSSQLNELNKHCGPLSFSNDGNFVVFTKTGMYPDKSNTYNMQLYFAESPNGKKWKNPELIPFCKKEYNFMHPALSPDGKMLYFVSDKPGGEGGTDIYVSELGKKGWGKPVNLGTEINTSFNEGFPFIDANGRLFFSSKGHHGFGGFDIFVTEKEENGMWSQPENIGSPVNSSYDDISFCIDESFSKGMFSSSRETNNDNIYLFGISAPEILTRRSETSKTETAATTTPKVSASDVLTEKGIQNDENNPENVVSITQLEIMNGSEKSHPQNESKPLDSPSATKELPTAKVMPTPAIYPFIQIKALLRNGETLSGKTFRMNSLQFEKSQYVITDEMTSNLNTLLDIMNRFPDLKVEVDVHTSSIGDDLENLEVSKARAAAIVAFMIENGIAAGRIQATGFGEKHLMNHCANDIPCSEKDHETNERVELSFF